MRNLLLTSTAAACLLLAAQVAQAQDHSKKDEQKQEHVQRAPGAEHAKHENEARQPKQENRAEQRAPHKAQSAAERSHRPSTTGQATENNEPKNKNESAGSENKPASTAAKPSENNEAKGKNAQKESSKNKPESKSAAERHKNEKANKSANEQKPNEQNKTNAASEQNKANENAKSSTAQTPNNAAKSNQENAAAPNNKSNTANTTNETNTRNTANTAQPNTTVNANNQQISQDKKVKISETISRHHDLAAPVRNLDISINVGERVPSRIHLHSLPREIVTIAPEYRGYDYFTTEEDVVIVSPRTHEIVTRIPRDVSRARAEVGGGASMAVTSGGGSGAMPCQVMRRTASGEMNPVSASQLRQTTGSAGGSDRLAVKVQAPNGQQMPEVALQAREGRIIAETNGSDCRITLEPGTMQ